MSARPGASARWAHLPERSNLATLRLMIWIALTLGRPVARLLLVPITAYFLLAAPRARRASRDYLRRALGRPPRLPDLARHFHTFAATILDRVFLLADQFERFDFEIEGEPRMRALIDEERGALLFGAHLGSFEVVRALARRFPGLSVALTMYQDNARKIARALDAINPATRPRIIPLGQLDTMLKVRDELDAGGLVGLLADRGLGDEACRSVRLLDAPVRIPLGPFRMAAMLRQRVVFMAGLYLGGRRYRIRFVEIADFSSLDRGERAAAVDAAIDRYVAELEACCRAAPFNWFNFFDFWATPEAAP